MPSEQSVWYRLGFALEQARHGQGGSARKKLTALAKRKTTRPAEHRSPSKPGKRTKAGTSSKPGKSTSPTAWPAADDLMASGAVALAARALGLWKPRRTTGVTRLLKAGLAGAGAALLVELVRPLLAGRAELPELGTDVADKLIRGAGQGLIYGAMLEPRIPGHPLLKGSLYGSVEYAVDPAGGLVRLLAPYGPLKSLPVLTKLLDGLDHHDRAYLEHVTFGIALALLYGPSPSSSGIRLDDGM